MLLKPTNRKGSDTSSPVCVKLITRAINAGINTERLSSKMAGKRNPQAVTLLRKDCQNPRWIGTVITKKVVLRGD